jgi:hypothetical protein
VGSVISKDYPLSRFAKNQKEFLDFQRMIQGNSEIPWMNSWMQKCDSKEEEECIWQNFWLSLFTTDANVPSPRIQMVIELLKQDGILNQKNHFKGRKFMLCSGLFSGESLEQDLNFWLFSNLCIFEELFYLHRSITYEKKFHLLILDSAIHDS